jgi:hypothetical protein
MDGMITCIACNEERRVDRMSSHILSKHRENVIKCKLNKEIIEENLKNNDYTIHICLSSPTGEEDQRIHCSLGFVSGWKTKKLTKVSMSKAKEHRDKHKEICKALLKEMNPVEIQKKETPELTQAYKILEKKYKKLEEDYEDVNNENTCEMIIHSTFLDVIAHKYNISKKELSRLEDDIRDIITDDSLTDEERQETIRQTYLK